MAVVERIGLPPVPVAEVGTVMVELDEAMTMAVGTAELSTTLPPLVMETSGKVAITTAVPRMRVRVTVRVEVEVEVVVASLETAS